MVDTNFEHGDEISLYQILSEIKELKQLVAQKNSSGVSGAADEKPLDSADVMDYLHICRRTLTKYKKQGMPFHGTGKPLFWKYEVDAFIKQKNNNNGN